MVLVTGGTGFIGSHLVEELLAAGRQVRVLALKNPFEPIEVENLKIIKGKGAEVVYGDLRDRDNLCPAIEGVRTVFHLGAVSRPMAIRPHVYWDINSRGTKNILEASQAAGVEKFVHVSTVSVLGGSLDGHPLKEDDYQQGLGSYAISKLTAEHLALEFYQRHNLPVVIVRPCLIYGPRCLPRLVIFKYVKKGLFPIFNGGRALMEFCYVKNLVEAILLAERNKEVLGEVFNITDGRSYPIGKILQTITEELGVRPPFLKPPVWAGKLAGLGMEAMSKVIGIHPPFSRTAADWMSKTQSVYDCTKAKELLGYNPTISLNEGVRETIAWYKEHGLL